MGLVWPVLGDPVSQNKRNGGAVDFCLLGTGERGYLAHASPVMCRLPKGPKVTGPVNDRLKLLQRSLS